MEKKDKIFEKIKPALKISLVGNEKFFGKGIEELLTLIDKYGTVTKACNIMGLSYSKAWKIINRLENEIGFKIVEGKAGGTSGGKTTLTNDAKELLSKYSKFAKDVEKYADKSYKKYFIIKGI